MLKEGIYEEIINIKMKEKLDLFDIKDFQLEKETLDVEEARKFLSSYISNVTRKALQYLRDKETNDKEALLKQIKACNELIITLSQQLDEEEFERLQIDDKGEVLHSIYSKINSVKGIKKEKPIRPVTPISESTLFTGSKSEPDMLSELKKEILSSDQLDFLVSFVKWSGIRCIIEELKAFTENGGKLRVITTSYMEATDYKAIIELSKLKNTEIKISYDIDRTRLHAKAYMFKRETGFTTAYIGSSNLSNPALTSGLEWNMKVTEKDSPDIIRKFEATFESYWNDGEFKDFKGDEEASKRKLKHALSRKKQLVENDIHFKLDIQPYHYQKEMLDNLQAEREVFGRNRNLLVAATGVGKTVISAFDYKKFIQKNTNNTKLLFVAHREEILKQSRDTFRAILKDFNFGDLLVGGSTPNSLDHLFVSIQSFNSMNLHEKVTDDFYDFIIVDEFHHAAANSYQTLLSYFKPKILLGLTATPERMDGQDITKYFDGKIASEMRLTEAIDRKLLSPFQYFGVSDTVDLSSLKWSRKGYDLKELENVYTNNRIRSNQIINSLYKYVTDIDDVKGLGFCAGIEHAKYMAQVFNERNIPAVALHGDSDKEVRRSSQRKLSAGKISFIFVADLYNEGVDIPDVNTILFLRPTNSLTVFLQQLGRGLRLAEGKECLTVLDFIGQAHKKYNFEEKFRTLVGKTKHSIEYYVDNGFSDLPRGSFILLEKQAKEYVLRNIKASKNTKQNLINKMKTFEQDTGLELTLFNFLNHNNLSLYDFYGRNGNRSFQRMMVEAGLSQDFFCENEDKIVKRFHKLFPLNSKKILDFFIKYVQTAGEYHIKNKEEKLMENMLYYSFYKKEPSKEGLATINDGLKRIFENKHIQMEILQILEFSYYSIKTIEIENEFDFITPLTVHSTYTKEQIMAALGYFNEEKCPAFREGVKHFKDKKLDIFFTTLNKSEKDFSPSTLYEDYAINEELFHWQTQSTLTESSRTAQRYINHKSLDHKIALFVREYKQENGYTAPFTFLGTCDYVSHSGEKPISFIWRLKNQLPPELLPKANKSII
ncbi:DEAD/DEAH box helicase [Oceanobacillus senegalensis]|uniref:DEAD/DEAH box helicase n=1 Tax=Oceanobacillus senegalensis TaxID=1936063 RepID=UPI001C4EB443|nr:DEAD/DEAH box helicase [Oceanobacillus senegalensis]